MGDGNDINEGLLDSHDGHNNSTHHIPRGARSEGSSSSDTIAAEGGFDRPDERLDGNLSELEEDSDDAPPTPRFMQDEGSWRRFRWVPYSVRRFGKAAAQWSKGPENAEPFTIEPLFPVVQHAPIQLLDKLLDRLPGSKDDPIKSRIRWRRGLLAGLLGIWLLTFVLVMRRGVVAGEMADWGIPGDIGCGNTYWVPGNMCGLDGSACRPFNGSGFAFRCPATCGGYQVLNPRAVGDKEVVYSTLVVGGPNSGANGTDHIYRGDSFICSAAIHAGVINNAAGGCGVVRLVGRQTNFAASENNGIQSIAFDSFFPLAFTFEQGVGCPGQQDARWPLLAVSVTFSTVLSLFVTSPAAFFFSIFTGLFWHVGLASDPPPHASIPALISNIVGKFLPAALVAWVIFDVMAVRRTLTGLTAQIEKTVLWLGGCWVGSLNNYTFDGIPIQRLTPHDLAQQPGAKAALAIIITLLSTIAASQIWYFRREGRLRQYLKLYILFISGLVFCMLLPGLKLRIHHYIVALLLLPGTCMQTRPALLYQGILVGLFINGIARWGWDSLLQTAAALQDDSQLNSPLPTLLEPVIRLANTTVATAIEAAVDGATNLLSSDALLAGLLTAAANTSSISFSWQPPPGPRYDGISVLVNDVERYRGYFDDFVEADETNHGVATFTWERPADVAAAGVDEYFRFGYMEGSQTDDYTRAGIWTAEGAWVPMPPGPSRVKSREVAGMR